MAALDQVIESPILGSPYDEPGQHFRIGHHGPTGDVQPGRRPSESWIPVAAKKKRASLDEELDFDVTHERREKNPLINALRRDVDIWRQRDYPFATAVSRKLMRHWSDPDRGEDRVFFCQREAAETAVFLAEVAGRHGYRDWRRELDPVNETHNAALPRVALKMATGTGKTVVMAMLIAWQTLNKVTSSRDGRFTNRFLVVTPGITIRDRLQVLRPELGGNYYDQRNLVPADLRGPLGTAQVVITNYHAFLLKDAKEIRGVASNTRKLLLAGKDQDPFRETPQAMVGRVLKGLGGAGPRKQPVVVFNDEAHHCYRDAPLTSGKVSKEEADANEDARRWFQGLQAVAKRVGIKTVYDLSATPFYLKGSGYQEGYIFPWTVSDFGLMDAIESGIVKVPRLPVDDDAVGDQVTYLQLWEHVGERLPKRRDLKGLSAKDWPIPKELEGALFSLYRSYRRAFEHWQAELRQYGETPPVFIVVCPNTAVSKLVYEWISGWEVGTGDGPVLHAAGNLELFSNVVGGRPLSRPRSILVDSAQLESGEALKPDFRAAAGAEIEAFKAELRLRNPGQEQELTDADILREVMNTVGKRGKLGEGVRCVVSVSMLTEGWDANTVSHILGVRAFQSQLLCEQVMGRGLRRRSYALNDEGRFEPEYANVYGIPFQFLPTSRPAPEVLPKPPAQVVCSLPDREGLRIEFPRLDGYRFEIPDEELELDTERAPRFVIGPSTVPNWVEIGGIVGAAEEDRVDWSRHRPQEIAYRLAQQIVESPQLKPTPDDRRPWLFPRLVALCRAWLEDCVDTEPGFSVGHLMISEFRHQAAEAILRAIYHHGDRRARLRPMLRPFEPTGSTADVFFTTRKPSIPTTRSEVSHVVLDGKGGNTWEERFAAICESHPDVAAYVKNDHVEFKIPYLHKGTTRAFLPDFLVRLVQRDGDVERTLVVEVSGGAKEAHTPGLAKVKAETARYQWCTAVNNHQGFGRWGFTEITDMATARDNLSAAIRSLYDDGPVIGEPDHSDFSYARTVRGGLARGA